MRDGLQERIVCWKYQICNNMAGAIIFSVVGRSLRQTVVKEKTIIDSRWLQPTTLLNKALP